MSRRSPHLRPTVTLTALVAVAVLPVGAATALAQPAADPGVDPLASPDPLAAPPPEPEPAPPEEAAPPPGGLTYDKGFKLTSADGDFALKLSGRLQSRWELAVPDTDMEDEAEHHFEIARARVTLAGKAYGAVDYKFQTEFGKGFVYLRDFYLDARLGPAKVRAGQYKKPFSRQQITSSGSLQLVDRSLTDGFAGGGRDIGVMVHNGYDKSPAGLEWALGVFNGTGDRPRIRCGFDPVEMSVEDCRQTNVPGDIGPQLAARVGFNVGGIKGYSESDLEGGPLRFAVAASYLVDLAELEAGEAIEHRFAADTIVKAVGFSLTGGFYLVRRAGEDSDHGAFVQSGYFVVPKRLEVAARFSDVPHPEATDERRHEILGGVNWFVHGHGLKWQTDAGVIHDTAGQGRGEVVVRTQAQLVF